MTKKENLLEQFQKTISRLDEALALEKNDIVRDSCIQRFEFTLDMAWKLLKEVLEQEKGVICKSPKDCFREAFQTGILDYDDFWISMVDMRNETVHTYKDETAQKIYNALPKTLEYFKNLLSKIT